MNRAASKTQALLVFATAALVIVGLAAHETRLARAAEVLPDGKPSPLPTDTMDLDYSSVCDDLTKVQNQSQVPQIQHYCDAAQAAKKAAKAENNMFKVYGGVAGVCAASCLVSQTQTENQGAVQAAGLVCTGVVVGGAVMDMQTTKNYQTAMQGLMGAGAGMMMGGGLFGGAAGGAAAGAAAGSAGGSAAGGGMASCLSAAVAGGQMFQKKQAQDDDDKKYKQNLESAAQLKYSPGVDGAPMVSMNFSPAAEEGMHGGQHAGKSVGTAPGSGNKSGGLQAGGGSQTDALCDAGAGSKGNGLASIQCAIAHDPNIPGMVTDPNFANNLSKISGKPLDQFMNDMNKGSPAAALAGNMSGMLNSLGVGKMTAAFKPLEDQFYHDSAGTYAAGGGGAGKNGAAADGDGNGDMSKMMADLMKGMNPDDKGGGNQMSVEAFGEKMRKLASIQNIEENRGISLFDRVSSRYYAIDKKDAFSATAPRR